MGNGVTKSAIKKPPGAGPQSFFINAAHEAVRVAGLPAGLASVSEQATFDRDSHKLFQLIDLDKNGTLSFSEAKR